MSDAAARAAERIKEIQEQAIRRRTQPAATATTKPAVNDARLAKIEENTFYKILMSNATPSQKKAEATKAMLATDDKTADKTRMRERAIYEEWMQAQREKLAMEVIRLTDTDTEAETQKTFRDIGHGIIEFEDNMKPLTDLLKGLFDLRMKGKTQDAIREIKNDAENRARRAKEQADREIRLNELEEQIKTKESEISVLEEDKTFIFFGSVKKESQDKITVKKSEIESAAKEIADITAAIEKAATEADSESALGADLAEAKEQLRTLFDLTSDEHIERKKKLIEAAKSFVVNTKDRVGNVMDHMEGMSKQIDTLFEAGTRMRGMYAIMNDASKDAKVENSKIRGNLQNGTPEESEMEKLEREDRLMAVEDHIASLDMASNSTVSELAQLTAQTGRVKSMKDSNALQMQKTLSLKTSGIAGIADKLAFTLQAVSQAALNESSEMAENSITHMNKGTNETISQEVFRIAVGMEEGNNKSRQAIEELEKFGETLRTSTQLQIQGIAEAQRLNEEFNQQAQKLQEDLKSAIAVHADVTDGTAAEAATLQKSALDKKAPAATMASPFGLN